jgi:hypothetical protein
MSFEAPAPIQAPVLAHTLEHIWLLELLGPWRTAIFTEVCETAQLRTCGVLGQREGSASAAPHAGTLRAGEMQEPSKRAAEAIVKQQDNLVEQLTHGHPF